jgi:glycosyltransferase involved in cell wall biosynthesis
MRPRLSIIVPFHKGLPFLQRALSGLTPRHPDDELIIAADGAVDDCRLLAATYGARVVEIAGPRGPAVARNAAAATATGDVLVFVDADVVASPDTLERTARTFSADPHVTAVFGAYDDDPGAAGFVSQYKNLAHSYIHRISKGAAKTFWAGFGAVRRDAFLSVGGFDERFERPSIEDIDLGYRLTAAGHRILLDPALAVCHLKRWTLSSMIKSDVLDRGIPWTQLILRYQQFGGDLNVKTTYRLSVVAAYLIVLFAIAGLIDLRFLAGVVPPLALLVYWGWDYYRFFAARRGLTFALRVFPLHLLTHLYNGISFVVGTGLFMAARNLDLRLPGSLPARALDAAGAGNSISAVATGLAADFAKAPAGRQDR